MLERLEKLYKDQNVEFHFIIGADLLPGLIRWDHGEELLKTKHLVIFERAGYVIDPEKQGYQMPNHYQLVKSDKMLFNPNISSS